MSAALTFPALMVAVLATWIVIVVRRGWIATSTTPAAWTYDDPDDLLDECFAALANEDQAVLDDAERIVRDCAADQPYDWQHDPGAFK